MSYIQEFDKVFKQYKSIEFPFSQKEYEDNIAKYVHYSNSLEGNLLNLMQTTELLQKNKISGDNVRFADVLEAKGHAKALEFVVAAANNKYPFNDRILKQANSLILSSLWESGDTYYSESKSKGQELGEYKVQQNKIVWELGNDKGEILPISTPENVQSNMIGIIDEFNHSEAHIIEKISFLAYQIYINQAFVDGNKRTARLMTTFATLKAGLPFSTFNKLGKNTNFNHALITTYLKNDKQIIESFLAKTFTTEMAQKIEQNKAISKPKNLGFLI